MRPLGRDLLYPKLRITLPPSIHTHLGADHEALLAIHSVRASGSDTYAQSSRPFPPNCYLATPLCLVQRKQPPYLLVCDQFDPSARSGVSLASIVTASGILLVADHRSSVRTSIRWGGAVDEALTTLGSGSIRDGVRLVVEKVAR